ncbi:hypothetical protein [Rhodalgimonas zhirmunskyi]|uniref:Uncharacterized protein n=1 Tax=Rhodalgimonas zhirmunskyi TaxID=2964767 RepID=A0AAJ1U923_9RHOB|nr:hypothetical protein [Rhodoalgimonas zhirmunskyi]MDQ2095845.1 hypothetical protein [Rhodoalgimonas zhirmunskyi]
MKQAIFPVLFALLAAPQMAAAQSVSECDWRASAANMIEPWEKNTLSYSNGAVRVAALDTIDPAATPIHLLVLSPPADELGARQCRIISSEGGQGFAFLDMSEFRAAYDPAKGLMFDVPVGIYIAEGHTVVRGLIVTLNQATGGIETHFATEREIGD